MRTLWMALVIGIPAAPGRAASYVEQASFQVGAARIAGLGRDTVGNVYVLGLELGATAYSVTGYRAPSMEPLFSFGTGATNPLAFAVEPSGVVDVLDGAGSEFVLRRFLNTGAFVGQSSFTLGPYISTSSLLSAAIDPLNDRLYLSYQNYRSYYCLMCLGCPCPQSGIKGYVNVYDLSGRPVQMIELPGIHVTAGSCYTPSKVAATPQGELAVLDAGCDKLLRYSPAGTLLGETSVLAATDGMAPRALWSDAESSLYVSQTLCGADGCLPRVLRLAADGTRQTTLTADSPFGCAWDARVLYLSSSGQRPLRRFVFNEPPAVPTPSAPVGSVVQHSSSAWLRWQGGSDGDGDPVAFSVELGTGPFSLKSAGTVDAPEMITRALEFGTTYYWRVTAQDAYLGLPLQTRSSPVGSFVMSLVNAAPGPFTVVAGSGTALTRNSSAAVSWSRALDPDGDVPVYELSWRRHDEAQPLTIVTTGTAVSLGGLAFGATYYWRVRALDDYRAERWLDGGAEQFYAPVFRNSAPAPVVYLSTPVFVSRQTQFSLAWLPSEDPDEDAVGYQLYLSTDPTRLALAQEGPLTSYSLPLSYGTTVYYRVSAVDAFGARAEGARRSFLPIFRNAAPSAPGNLTRTGTVAYHGFSPSLSFFWTPAQDEDGDPLSYSVYFGTDSGRLSPVSPASLGLTIPNLAVNTAYYYKLVATDAFGAVSDSPTHWVFHEFSNQAPSPFEVTGGTGTASTRDNSALLSWTTSNDADGDQIGYRVFVGTTPGELAPTLTTLQTSAALRDLQFGVTYYWRVEAYDALGATTTAGGQQRLLHVLRNAAPAAIQYLAPVSLSTRAASYPLAWAASGDPDGDEVSYRLELGTATDALAEVQSSPAVSYPLPLAYGTTYFYRVTARDGFGAATPGPIRTFHAAFLNDPPQPVKLAAPFLNSPTVKTMRDGVELSWRRVSNPQNDPITYTVFLGDSPETLSPVVRLEQLPGAASARLATLAARPQAEATEDGDTLRLKLGGLGYYRSYYLKLTAANPFGAASQTPVQFFTLSASDGFPPVYNYPNPFSPSRGGTNVVFNSPPPGYPKARLSVYSEFGELLAEREFGPIPQGVVRFSFDGRDRGGRPLPNGSYVGRVRFDGSSRTETFFLLVVR